MDRDFTVKPEQAEPALLEFDEARKNKLEKAEANTNDEKAKAKSGE